MRRKRPTLKETDKLREERDRLERYVRDLLIFLSSWYTQDERREKLSAVNRTIADIVAGRRLLKTQLR